MALHVQAALQADSGNPKDIFVNTWAVNTNSVSPTQAQADAVLEAIGDFYVEASGATGSWGSFLSDFVKQTNGLVLKAYDITGKLDGSPAGSPVAVATRNVPTRSNDKALPADSAVCITLNGTDWDDQPVELSGPPVTRPMQRRRGRVYLGPLNADVITAAVNGDAIVSSNFRDNVMVHLVALQAAIEAIAANYSLAIWSRSEESLFFIESASMDDRVDNVRSRRRVATLRPAAVPL